jgi:hypothetical protein
LQTQLAVLMAERAATAVIVSKDVVITSTPVALPKA